MKSKYGIPGETLAKIRQRDRNCVYCRVEMPDWKDRKNGSHYATIEHVYPPGDDPTWVFFCCNACNIRHQVPLREWFKTTYCLERGINEHTVAEPVRRFLASGLKEAEQIWLDGRDHVFLETVNWTDADAVPGRPFEHIERERLSPAEQKGFDRILKAIEKRKRYEQAYRGRAEDFGKYYGFKYWPKDGVLYREPEK